MASNTNSPEPSSHIPEGLTPLNEYRRAAEEERIRAEITFRNAMLKLEKAREIDEEFLVDEHGRFYTSDASRACSVGYERVPILAYGPHDLIGEDVLERYPFIGRALSSIHADRLESISFEEERLVLGIPMIRSNTFIDARCYLDERGVVLTRRIEAYLTLRGERETITAVRHGLPVDAIGDYLIAQGTPNAVIDEALTLIERRRAKHPEK